MSEVKNGASWKVDGEMEMNPKLRWVRDVVFICWGSCRLQVRYSRFLGGAGQYGGSELGSI